MSAHGIFGDWFYLNSGYLVLSVHNMAIDKYIGLYQPTCIMFLCSFGMVSLHGKLILEWLKNICVIGRLIKRLNCSITDYCV